MVSCSLWILGAVCISSTKTKWQHHRQHQRAYGYVICAASGRSLRPLSLTLVSKQCSSSALAVRLRRFQIWLKREPRNRASTSFMRWLVRLKIVIGVTLREKIGRGCSVKLRGNVCSMPCSHTPATTRLPYSTNLYLSDRCHMIWCSLVTITLHVVFSPRGYRSTERVTR